MSGEDYYAHQARARGIHSAADVERIAGQLASTYSRILCKWLPTKKDAVIYEAACGPGIMLRWLQSQGYSKIAGSDSSGPEIILARSTGAEVRQANSLDDLKKQQAESIDCVIAIDFIEHLSKDALLDFMRESFRVLTPNGVLILRAPNGDSPVVGRNLFNDITHVWAYTTTALRALAGIAGFRDVIFADDTIVAVQHQRWLRVPLMRIAQTLLKLLLRFATRENVQFIGASYYACLRK